MKNLYHGSIYDFQFIDLNKGLGFRDFGKGFYATAVKAHAEGIARRNKRRAESKTHRHVTAYRYNLEFDDKNLGGLNVLRFKEPDIEWVKFIIYNRTYNGKPHNYDIVIGPTADAYTVESITQFTHKHRNPTRAEYLDLIEELKARRLPIQYHFGTQRALSKLRFKNKYTGEWREVLR